MKRLLLTASIIAVSLVALFPTKASALTISPTRYEIAGDPGQTLTQTLKVFNEGKKQQLYYVSFANFEAQGDTGSPTFVEPKDGLGTWISTSQASINLAPGEQKEIEFTIKIPKDAEPGGHFAALFWGTSAPGTSDGISIGTKTGVLILLSVSGDIKEDAGLVDFQTHNKQWFYKMLPVGFQYRFSNQGDDRVKPKGNIVIRSILGWRVKKVNANPYDGNVLPRTTRRFTPEWSKRDSVEDRDQQLARKEAYSFKKALSDEWHNFAVGIFQARIVAEFGSTNQQLKSNKVYFVVFPWELLLVASIVGLIVYFILKILIRRYNRAIIRRAQEQFINQQRL